MGVVFWPSANYVEIFRTTKVGVLAANLQSISGVVVDWGDGFVESVNSVSATHTYNTSGEKIVAFREGRVGLRSFGLDSQNITSVTARSLTSLRGSFVVRNNPGLNRLEYPVSEEIFTEFLISNNALTGVQDFTQIPNIGGRFNIASNTGVTGLRFGQQTKQNINFLTFIAEGLSLTGTLDLSSLSNLGGEVRLAANAQLTNILFPVSVNNFTILTINSCDLTGVLDVSMIKPTTVFHFYNNKNLTGVLLNANHVYTGSFWGYGCKLNQVFPLGTLIRGTDIRIYSNGMSQANVNATIDSLYQNRANFATTAKQLQIHGTNAAPSGTALTQIADLRANYNWTITHS